MTWPGLPVLIKVAGQPVILLGDGEAADAKRRVLERAGAVVVGDHPQARLAIVAIEEEAEAVAAVAALRARRVFVNAVDRPELCDFTLPAVVDRSPVLVAVATGGVSAGLAAAVRQRLEGILSSKLGALARHLSDWRPRLREVFPDAGDRRRAIARSLAPGGVLDLADPDLEDPFWIDDVRAGSDWTIAYIRLRGTDPDELTLREARLLAQADRVIHAAGIPAAILDRTRADAPRTIGEEPRVAGTAPPSERKPGLTVWVGWA